MHIMTANGWRLIGGPMSPARPQPPLHPVHVTARKELEYSELFKRKDGTDMRDNPNPPGSRYFYEHRTAAQIAELALEAA